MSGLPIENNILSFISRPRNKRTTTLIAITSINGIGTIDGTSGKLGNATDAQLFNSLRSLADVVLVGTSTIKAENYGPVELAPEVPPYRVSSGQSPEVLMATMSHSLNIEPDSDFVKKATTGPLIFTTPTSKLEPSEAQQHLARKNALLTAGAKIIEFDNLSIDKVVDWFHSHDLADVIVEGGPSIYRQALESGIVDEIFLTLAPWWVQFGASTFGNREKSPGSAAASAPLSAQFELKDSFVADSHCFLRYQRKPSG